VSRSAELGRAAVALVVATVACVVVVVTLTMPGTATELESNAQQLFQGEKKLGGMEMLAARAQDHLLLKDKRIFQSLNLAARKKAIEAENEDVKFKQARNTQIALDQRLAQLSGKLHAQEQALAYMAPKLEERMQSTNQLSGMVQQLDQVMPQIKPDLKKVNEELQEIADAGKQAQEEALTADEELKKYGNAYNLFGERMQQARQQSAQARNEVEEDNVGALRATEYATQLRQRATMAQNSQEGRMLVAEAERETARADMLNKESTEASQSTQLHDAEADEAMAYMSMFGADANVADARLKLEGQKLQALSRQYARGKYLAAMGQQREAYLKSEDKRATAELKRAELVAEDDKLAFMTGEKSTKATAEEVGVEERAAEGNTVQAEKDITKLDQDKNQWETDSEQADAIRQAGEAHVHAAEHLEEAAELDPK